MFNNITYDFSVSPSEQTEQLFLEIKMLEKIPNMYRSLAASGHYHCIAEVTPHKYI